MLYYIEKHHRCQPSSWIFHTCDDPGCSSRIIVTDICEKLYRSKCAAPAVGTTCMHLHPNIDTFCFNYKKKKSPSPMSCEMCFVFKLFI